MAWSLPETAITSQAASVTAWINFLLAKSKSLFLLEKPVRSLLWILALRFTVYSEIVCWLSAL